MDDSAEDETHHDVAGQDRLSGLPLTRLGRVIVIVFDPPEAYEMFKIFSLTPVSKTPNSLYNLMIRCKVTPASRGREGIRRVSDEHVYVHVGAEPKKGQANDAVCRVLSEVLDVPRSDVIIQGKNREKLVLVEGLRLAPDTEDTFLQNLKSKLEAACAMKGK